MKVIKTLIGVNPPIQNEPMPGTFYKYPVAAINDHPALCAGWLEFVHSRTKAKARPCFTRGVCNRCKAPGFTQTINKPIGLRQNFTRNGGQLT